MVIRDLCLYYAGAETTPQRRVARARAALEQIAENSDAAEPYGLLLRNEARRLKHVPASYILGEFLAPDNTPCTVRDFIDRVAGHGLDYLCEVDLCAAVPNSLDLSIRSRITSLAGASRSAAEQHIDFLTGRLFRRSVLVRRQPAADAQRVLSPDALNVLHISSPVRLDAAQSNGQVSVFTDDRARPITVKDPAISQAIARLEAAFPATLSLDQLVVASDARAGIETRIRQAVFAMVLADRASVSVLPLRVGRATDERPKVWSVARTEAASGQPWITSLRHVGVPTHPVLTALMPHLDGSHDRAALRARLAAALQGGTVQVPELPADQPPPSRERLNAVADQYVDWALSHLAHHAFLEPGSTRDDQHADALGKGRA